MPGTASARKGVQAEEMKEESRRAGYCGRVVPSREWECERGISIGNGGLGVDRI